MLKPAPSQLSNQKITPLKVVGLYHSSQFENQYGGVFGQGYTGYRIYVDLTKAQTMLNYTDQINSISIKLTDSKQTSTRSKRP